MGRRVAVAVILSVVVGVTAGTVAAVTIDMHPQQVTLSDHGVTAGKEYSIDERTTVYSSAGIDGYDVIIRNDGSTDLSINVTVRLLTIDGSVVATASESVTVLTGATATANVRFDTSVNVSAYDWVEVEAAA